MTLTVRPAYWMGHQHSSRSLVEALSYGNKHLTEYAFIGSLLAMFITATMAPWPALAFEAQLPSASAARLVAPVELNGRDTPETVAVVAQPDYSNRLAGVVQGVPSIETEVGDWPEESLALVEEQVVSVEDRLRPTPGEPVVLEGEASYYSRAGCLGCDPLMIMANGRPLDDSKLTMAIGADKKHLVGYRAKVTSLVTGLSADVLITDTGGFYKARYGHRVADLSVATKQAIGMRGGVGQVRVEVY